jgi:hypothetical protein
MRGAFLKLFWLVAGIALTLFLLEIVMRMLPVSLGMHRTTDYARWPLQNTEPNLHYTYSLGWSMQNAHRGTTNNYGQVAPFDFRKGRRPVIVIGDSYVESLMNPFEDTLQAQLAGRIGTPDAVYGMGISGLSASDYVGLSRLARDEFAPRAAVFLVTDGDLSESLFARTGNHSLAPAGDTFRLNYEPVRGDSTVSRVRRIIGDISLHRYLQANLHFSLDPLFDALRGRDAATPALATRPFDDPGLQKKVADWFLAELPGSLALPPECIVLLVDTDRFAMYKPSAASTRKDKPEAREYLLERARLLGFRVSDLEMVFRERYARSHAKFDHWPIDRHWNRLGHGIGAEESYRLLYQEAGPQGHACLAGQRH